VRLLYPTGEQVVFVLVVFVKRRPMHHRTITDLLHANRFKRLLGHQDQQCLLEQLVGAPDA
jgi:hypothetical protein